jgi:hypothetical protein
MVGGAVAAGRGRLQWSGYIISERRSPRTVNLRSTGPMSPVPERLRMSMKSRKQRFGASFFSHSRAVGADDRALTDQLYGPILLTWGRDA